MRTWLSLTFAISLISACGSDNKTSASDDSTSAASETDGATGSPTSGTPTSGGAESSGSESSGGEPKIIAEDTQRVCDGQPGGLLPEQLHTPPLAAPGLTAKALGDGKIAVTETEYLENCGYNFTAIPELTAANTISLTYQAMGEIADCECNFTIDSTLSGLTPGTWTIESGALTAMVDVT